MTCAAPSERTSSTLRVLHTPVTSAPIATAICTANEPTPPLAPLTSTRCPAFTAPTSRIPRRAVVAAMGSAAACSNVRLAGFGATLSSAAHAYSAKAPRTKPNTSSPGCSPCTFAPTASTTPAASLPTTGIFGLVSPIPMSRATYGSPRSDVPVGRVEGGGVHPDQHVVGSDLGQVDVHQPQRVRRPEPFLDDRLHRMPPASDVRARGTAPVRSEHVTRTERPVPR